MDPFTAFRLASDQNYWTATAALAAWVFGAIGLAMNALGLFLIWWQLRATRAGLVAAAKGAEAAAGAARAALATSRPWVKLSVESAVLHLKDATDSKVHCMLKATWENIGQTPALDVDFNYEVTFSHEEVTKLFAKVQAKPAIFGGVLFPGDTRQEEHGNELPAEAEHALPSKIAFIAAVLRYRSHALGEVHITPLSLIALPQHPTMEITKGAGSITCKIVLNPIRALAPT